MKCMHSLDSVLQELYGTSAFSYQIWIRAALLCRRTTWGLWIISTYTPCHTSYPLAHHITPCHTSNVYALYAAYPLTHHVTPQMLESPDRTLFPSSLLSDGHLHLLPRNPVWNCGDFPEIMFYMCGDYRENLLEFSTVVIMWSPISSVHGTWNRITLKYEIEIRARDLRDSRTSSVCTMCYVSCATIRLNDPNHVTALPCKSCVVLAIKCMPCVVLPMCYEYIQSCRLLGSIILTLWYFR